MTMPRTRRRRRHDEHGYSLLELMVVVLILGLVLPVLFNGLISVMNSSAGTQDRSFALANARTALEQIVRDLRAGDPIDVFASGPVAQYETTVGFETYCSNAGVGQCNASNRVHVVYEVLNNGLYEVDSLGNSKLLVGPSGPSSYPANLQEGAIVQDSSIPVFSYFDNNGNQLSTSAQSGVGAPMTFFRDCAKSVEVHLRVLARPGDVAHAYDLDTRVELRNFQVVAGC
jgi:prepilin-type N-terminal cleavage/methylation domain-containing protein